MSQQWETVSQTTKAIEENEKAGDHNEAEGRLHCKDFDAQLGLREIGDLV